MTAIIIFIIIFVVFSAEFPGLEPSSSRTASTLSSDTSVTSLSQLAIDKKVIPNCFEYLYVYHNDPILSSYFIIIDNILSNLSCLYIRYNIVAAVLSTILQ